MNYKHDEKFCIPFGKQLRKLREGKGISMRKLAAEAEMEYSQLSKIERRVINTTISTSQALAVALDIPVRELFDFKFLSKEN